MSKYRGGTLIAEDVADLATHARRICNPDGYRPAACPRCDGEVLHVHCYPERHPRGEAGMPSALQVVQYICAAGKCRATWRVLPLFLARHLWRVWKTVERAVRPSSAPPPAGAGPAIPKRTRARWQQRLASSARGLVVLLAASGAALLEAIATHVGLDGTRRDLIEAYVAAAGATAALAQLAGLVHRLERGLRLM